MTGLHWALGFLTALPVRPRGELEPGDLGRAAGWFPVVGLGLGILLWGASWLLNPLLGSGLASALLLGLWVAATGALHLDGLADCCDGLLASAPPSRRLDILADPHLGAFGVVGVVLLLLIKSAAIGELADTGALLFVPAAGRWIALLLAGGQPARPEGLGGRLHAELGRAGLFWLLPMGAGALLLGLRGLVALAAALLTAWALARLARARLGGQTGDVLGAGIELAETAMLVAFAVRLQP